MNIININRCLGIRLFARSLECEQRSSRLLLSSVYHAVSLSHVKRVAGLTADTENRTDVTLEVRRRFEDSASAPRHKRHQNMNSLSVPLLFQNAYLH